MDYKKLSLIDNSKPKDTTSIKATTIIGKIPGTDIVVFKKHNKVILPGAAFTARCHFDLPRAEITPSYNTALELENSVNETPTTKEKVYLFCCGTNGCGAEGSDIYAEEYAQWIGPEYIVPFRYPLISEDLDGTLRETYYGRKVADNRVAYYFKAFDTQPVLVQQYTDGTAIDSNVYNSAKTDEIETYVEITMSIKPEDCREWFLQTTGINDAKVNTFSLCTAWAKAFDSQIYYQDIRPLTRLNISNEWLIDQTKGIDMTYRLYY